MSWITLVTLLSLSPAPAAPQGPLLRPQEDAFEQGIVAIAKGALAHEAIEGLSLVVALGDEVLIADGWGLAGCGPERADADTLFAAGGLLDLLLAASAARLSERDELDLDAKVATLLEGFPFEGEGITVRQLLSHTSGLPALADLPAEQPLESASATDAQQSAAEAILARLSELPMNASPGSCQHYSGADVVALGAVLERVSGVEVRALVQREVIKPAGLSETNFDGPARPEETLHVRAMGGDLLAPASEPLPFGADRLQTNARDLVKLAVAMSRGALSSAGEVLAETVFVEGKARVFAHGLVTGALEQHPFTSFGAATGDCVVHCARYPDLDLTLAICASAGDAPAERIERRITRLIYDLPEPGIHDLPLPDDAEARYAGEYLVGCNSHWIDVRGERLHLSAPEGASFDLLNQGHELFVSALDPDISLLFEFEGDTAVAFVLDEHGARSIGRRMR